MADPARGRGLEPGGTPGGAGEFLAGLAMFTAGAYLLLSQVTVTTGWSLWGFDSFGLALLPLLIGIGVVFFDGRSKLGWLLVFVGSVIIFAGIIANLDIYFRPTSLFNTLAMLTLLAGGLGLIARAVRAH